jgi:peptide/nickel transport system substrate-binding protein
VGLLLAGCSSHAPVQPSGVATSTLPATAVKLLDGGTVVVGVPYLPTNFNPSSQAGANRVTDMVMEQVWPQSFVVDPQFVPEATGFLDVNDGAELVSVSPETIEYHIDVDARWADGVPITAADFVYNWHQQLLHAATSTVPGALSGYGDIQSITGTADGKTVTVVFKQPYADWEGLFRDLVPAHVGEKIGWNGFSAANLRQVVSGGPFEIASLEPGRELVLRRNPSWWGTPAHLESIVFKVVKGTAATWAAMRSGEIDIGEVQPDTGNALEAADDSLDSATTLSPVVWQLCFNLNDPVLGDPAIRSAVAEATDRAELVADTIGLDDPGVPVAENRIFLQGAPGSANDAGQFETVDDSGAVSLLEAAGFVPGSTGYLERNGSPLTLTVTAPSEASITQPIEAELQAEMKDAGIAVRFRNVPLTQLLTQVLPTSDYQVALAPFMGEPYQSWTQPLYNPPSTVGAAGADFGVQAGPAGGPSVVDSDASGLADPSVTSLYAKAEGQLGALAARNLYNEIDGLLWADMPTLPLFQEPVTLLTADDLVNVEESPTSAGFMWNAADWAIALNLPAPSPPSG